MFLYIFTYLFLEKDYFILVSLYIFTYLFTKKTKICL